MSVRTFIEIYVSYKPELLVKLKCDTRHLYQRVQSLR